MSAVDLSILATADLFCQSDPLVPDRPALGERFSVPRCAELRSHDVHVFQIRGCGDKPRVQKVRVQVQCSEERNKESNEVATKLPQTKTRGGQICAAMDETSAHEHKRGDNSGAASLSP